MSTYDSIIELIGEKLGNLSEITAAEHREVETAILDFARNQWQVGDLKMIDCTNQYVEDNFDLVSLEFYGRGKVGSEREGWAICNGLNGTMNRQGRVPVAWGDHGPNVNIDVDGDWTGTPGERYPNYVFDSVGNYLSFPHMKRIFTPVGVPVIGGGQIHKLTTNEMPQHQHPAPSGSTAYYGTKNTGYDSAGYAKGGEFDAPNGHFSRYTQTGLVGSNYGHNNMQPYMVTLFIQKIPEPY